MRGLGKRGGGDWYGGVEKECVICFLMLRSTPAAILEPITIVRSETECAFIEPSINSVRISLKIKQADEVEKLLCHKFSQFMMQRAEHFIILRRVPVPV